MVNRITNELRYFIRLNAFEDVAINYVNKITKQFLHNSVELTK